jgi:hypothetical protein
LKIIRRFGGTCRLHLQDRRISQTRKERKPSGEQSGLRYSLAPVVTLLADCFMLVLAWLILRPWRRRRHVRNVGWFSTDYTALYPIRQNSHNHRCENLRSYINSKPLKSVFTDSSRMFKIKTKKLRGFSPQANYTDRTTAASRRS